MPTIEQFGQQQRKTEQAEREKREPQGPMLAETLSHPEENVLFAKYLEKGGEDDKLLSGKLLSGRLDRKDFDVLIEKRKGFLGIKEKSKKIKERLEKNIDGVIHASPDLRKVKDGVGVEGIRSALLDRMDDIAITEPDRLADFEGQLSGLTAAETSVSRGNERIAALRKEWGFTEDEYTKAIIAREKGDSYALEDLVKGKMGFFKKIFTSSESLARQGKEVDTREDIKNRLALVDKNLNDIGSSLSTALFENETARQVLIANLKKENGPSPETSFSEMSDIAKKPLDEKAVADAWAKYQKDHGSDDGFELGAARSRFADEYAEGIVPKKRRGFWATILRAMFSSSVQQEIK